MANCLYLQFSDNFQPGITIATPDFVHHRKSKARYESQSPMESAKSSRSSISSSGSTTSTRYICHRVFLH